MVYKLIFKFHDLNENAFTVTVKTNKPEPLEDEKKEMLIYNQYNPKKAVLIDDLPWNVPEYIKTNWA